MSTTYSTLKTNIAAWINRTDLTSVIPTFVSMAADRIYLGSKLNIGGSTIENEPLRLASMLTTVNPFTGTLPSDCTAVKRLSWISSGTAPTQNKYPLEFVPLSKITKYEAASTASPNYFSLKGSTVIYGPTFTNDVELIYYARPTALTGDADVLPTGLESPYLYGALLEAAIYMKDDAGMQRYGLLFMASVQSVQDQDEDDTHTSGSLRIRPDFYV